MAMDAIARFRATMERRPVDRLHRAEFYIWDEALDRWEKEGMPPVARSGRAPRPGQVTMAEHFGFDPGARVGIPMLGWCEPPFVPAMKEEVLEERGEHQIVRDAAGRTVEVYKGRRHGFMPTYLRHAVTCERDWEESVRPLLSPDSPERWQDFDRRLAELRGEDRRGKYVHQPCIGGYMYLRALIGPQEVCYMLVDDPRLIHKMMTAWLELADAVTARIQREVQIDELFLAEDICYNHGLLISPDMVREFLFPYYQQLLANIRSRQKEGKTVHFQVDTDGNVAEALDLYMGIGLDVMCPFEVAAGNDVVEIARRHPGLALTGGIDKRALAAGPEAIDESLRRVLPFMVRRGGYYPTCDHGVPDNVSYADYMHYRRRVMERDH
jgi:hypothetical protein